MKLSPRWRRAWLMLLQNPRTGMDLAIGSGIANINATILAWRAKGLTIPCQRIEMRNRDGDVCHPGLFSLSESDRKKIRAWLGE